MTKRLIIAIVVLTSFFIRCGQDFQTKKLPLNKVDIESIAIVVEGDSIKCSWLQLSDAGIEKFVDTWNSSNEMIRKSDHEKYHPTLGLRVFLKNNTVRNFFTYGQFIKESDHDFFLDFSDKDFFMKLETAGPSTKIYGVDSATNSSQLSLTKPTVLILPPYDEIANAGISPNIQKYIEQLVAADTSLTLIPFPYKKLMHEPYSNVFDKKYCQGILKVVPCDYIVLSRLDYKKRTGHMDSDEWKFSIKIYDVKKDIQFLSKLSVDNSTDSVIQSRIANSDLSAEIKNGY